MAVGSGRRPRGHLAVDRLPDRLPALDEVWLEELELAVGEVEGRLCQELFAKTPSFLRILLDGIQGKGEWWERGVSFVRPDGREVPLEINTSLLEDEAGQTTGLLGIFRDLSLVHELEQRLRRADRLARRPG
jgi:hypothetical protein